VERPTPRRNQIGIRIVATAVTVSECLVRGLRVPRRYRVVFRLMAGVKAPRRRILGMVLAGDVVNGSEVPWHEDEMLTKKPKQAVVKVRSARSVVPAARASKSTKASAKKPALLAGGNPQLAKDDGDAPVQAYIAAMPGWKREVGRRLDALIVRTVPQVHKAVRWNSPFYGIEGQGWFLGFHVFTHYVKVTFFRGTSLRPVPPGGTGKDARWIDIHEEDLDEAQMATWVKQAAAIPGWGKS
jgi:hypothetical protein